jgi:LysM repeat protein
MNRPGVAHIVAIAAVVTACAFVTESAWAKAAPTKAAPGRSYVVRAGDGGWFQLARAHGTSMQHLLAANHATTTTSLKTGQRIHLPADAHEGGRKTAGNR